MRTRVALSVGLALVAGVFVAAPPALAIPAFSRLYGQSCTACHTAYPKLNRAGEEFRLSGYTRYEGGASIPKVPPVTAGKLSLPGIVPVSIIGTVGYDAVKTRERGREDMRRKTTDVNSLNLEEIEIMAAAPLNRHLSFILDFPLVETELEGKRFRLEGPEPPETASVSFNNLFADDLLNVRIGAYELPLGISPKLRRLSITPYLIYSTSAQTLLGLEEPGARGILREAEVFALDRPQLLVEAYGTAYSERLGVPDLYLRYHVGTSNDSNRNADNNSEKSVFGRLELGWGTYTLGFFGFYSPNILDRSRPVGFAGNRNAVTRFGPDLQLAFLDEALSISVQYLWGRDDNPTGLGRSFDFSGGFVQLDYALRSPFGTLVPLARFDYVTGDKFDNTARAEALGLEPLRTKPRVWALTGGLQYYPWENVKIMAEATYREREERLTKTASTVERDRVSETLLSLQVTLAF